MTVTARSKVKVLSLLASLLLSSFAIFSFLISLLSYSYILSPESLLAFSMNFGLYSYVSLQYTPLAVSISVLVFSITSLISLIYTYFAFRKLQSTEIIFFELFLFSLSWEALRLLIPYFSFSSIIMAELSSISRLLYFFRFMSLFSLLSMALFSTINITRQKTFIVATFIFISLMLSMSIPFDSTQINYLFLAGSPFMQGYVVLLATSSVFLIFTLIFYYLYERIQERLYMIGSSISLILGYSVLIFSGDYWTLVLGTFFFVYGVINIIRNIRSIYLWK